jgi:type I restriction enzyme S subunit
MLLPPLPLLECFDRFANPLLRFRSHLRHRIQQFATTRDLLLPRLVTGRLDISDVDLGVLTPSEID